MHSLYSKPGKPPAHPPIVLVETGEIFDTFKEAADAIGGDKTNVRRVVYGIQASYKGYHFQFLNN